LATLQVQNPTGLQGVIKMTVTLRVQRSRGALSGILLVILGIWGAMVPFVGPYFHYAYTPDSSWTYTAERMWLEVLPGIAAILGGLTVTASAHRAIAIFGAWLAAVAGAWYAVGSVIAVLWTRVPAAGTPVGGKDIVMLEQIGFFTGLGVVIVFMAALAIGRFTVVAARDAMLADRRGRSAAAVPAAAAAPKADQPRVTLIPAWIRSRMGHDAEDEPAGKTPARTR
jgi:hypothetical protein